MVNKLNLKILLGFTTLTLLGLMLPHAALASSIQSQIDSASSGATITIPAGTYPEHLTISKSLTLLCSGQCFTHGFTITGDNVTVKGFDVSSSGADGYPGFDVKAKSCDIENNYIHDTSRQGIFTEGTPSIPTASQNCKIINNKVYHAEMAGIDISGVNHLVEGNEVWGTMQHGPLWPNPPDYIDADGFRFFGSGHTFRNNYIHDIHFDGTINIDPHTDCFQTFDGSNNIAGHDILFDGNNCILPDETGGGMTNKGFQVEGGAYNLTMTNNVVHARLMAILNSHDAQTHNITMTSNTFVGYSNDPNSWGINITNDNYPTTNVKIQNNIFAYQENGIGSIWDTNSTSVASLTAGNNCVFRSTGKPFRPADPGDTWNLDPQFVNYSGNDFHLKSSSPCLGKGAYSTVSSAASSSTPSPSLATSPIPSPTLKLGDANGDRLVDLTDYNVWLSHYRESISGYQNGDFNNNGVVDGIDYVIWALNYGK